MKVIFSRKGFDGSAGGCPSPIIDRIPLSLPIPYLNSTKSYRHFNLGKIVADLTNGKLRECDYCHNDPDLKMGAFGQVSSAQSHLDNQNVGSGDLFLFFGWFREAGFVDGKYRYKKDARDHHRIFGWMFVDQKLTVGSETKQFSRNYPKYASHPHASGQWAPNNTIYIAPKTFSLFQKVSVKGFGRFRMSDRTLLSSHVAPTKRFWNVPDWLNPAKGGCIPSYHDERNYTDGLLKTAGRGQEFVCKPTQNDKFEKWVLDLFSEAVTNLD
jgi:hypothetical protein